MRTKLLGVDNDNYGDKTCRIYGYHKKGIIHITKIEIEEERVEE